MKLRSLRNVEKPKSVKRKIRAGRPIFSNPTGLKLCSFVLFIATNLYYL